MSIDLGLVQGLAAESFGQPGKRTFQLRFLGEYGETAGLAVEKQHIVGLSVALEQMLDHLGYEEKANPVTMVGFPARPDHTLQVGRMSIGLHDPDASLVLMVHDMTEIDEASPTLTVRFSQTQAAGLRLRLNEIIAAGRPICQLCGMPIDPEGHVCVRMNGHTKQPIPDTEADTDNN
jgi:uncharacterized repeat protein (TIGR03847 family)